MVSLVGKREGGASASTRRGRRKLRAEREEAGLIYKSVVEQAKAWSRGDLLGQMEYLLDKVTVEASIGRKRVVSFGTLDNYKTLCGLLVKKMAHMGKRPAAIDQISGRVVCEVLAAWRDEGVSVGSLKNRKTIYKRLLAWIGRADDAEMVEDLNLGTRSIVAQESKAWSEIGINVKELIKQVAEEDYVAALQMELMAAFGLRVLEAVNLRPIKSDLGNRILVESGTKGGRPRVVPITTEHQREILEKAKEVAAGTRQGTATQKGLRLDQSINRLYVVARKAGIKKEGLGVTLHGLRHEYASLVYKAVSGAAPPVEMGAKVDKRTDLKARDLVTRHLGHSRISVTAAYLGTNYTMTKVARRNLEIMAAKVESDVEVARIGASIGIDEVVVIGKPAAGAPIKKDSSVVFAVEDEKMVRIISSDELRPHFEKFRQALSAAISVRAEIVMTMTVPESEERFSLFLGRAPTGKEDLGVDPPNKVINDAGILERRSAP